MRPSPERRFIARHNLRRRRRSAAGDKRANRITLATFPPHCGRGRRRRLPAPDEPQNLPERVRLLLEAAIAIECALVARANQQVIARYRPRGCLRVSSWLRRPRERPQPSGPAQVARRRQTDDRCAHKLAAKCAESSFSRAVPIADTNTCAPHYTTRCARRPVGAARGWLSPAGRPRRTSRPAGSGRPADHKSSRARVSFANQVSYLSGQTKTRAPPAFINHCACERMRPAGRPAEVRVATAPRRQVT